MIVKAAILGGMVSAAGFLLFFLGTWAVELLRGYHFPPPWDRGLNSWMYLGIIIACVGTVIGGLSGVAWNLLRNRGTGTI
jgi:hypothetical protein